MKVGLKLGQQIIINTAYIVDVVTFNKNFHIGMSTGATYIVVRESEFESFLKDDEHSISVIVDLNEYLRIQKELSEFLGVDLDECLEDVSENVA